MFLHDGGNNICQLLMPWLDLRMFVNQQPLSVCATLEDEEHDDIHMLGDVAVA